MHQPEEPDDWDRISTLVAAAIIIPIGWWLHDLWIEPMTQFFAWILGQG